MHKNKFIINFKQEINVAEICVWIREKTEEDISIEKKTTKKFEIESSRNWQEIDKFYKWGTEKGDV